MKSSKYYTGMYILVYIDLFAMNLLFWIFHTRSCLYVCPSDLRFLEFETDSDLLGPIRNEDFI